MLGSEASSRQKAVEQVAYESIRDDSAHAEIVARIRRLSPECERAWGVMDHDQLIPHLVDGLRLAMNGTTRMPKGLLSAPVMRHLVIHRMKWPPGKAKAPAGAFQRVVEDWGRDRAELLGLIETYRSTPPEKVGGAHPIFGPMKPRDWDVLVWRHLDHHLRQFNC
jgi:hypothetical protein